MEDCFASSIVTASSLNAPSAFTVPIVEDTEERMAVFGVSVNAYPPARSAA